MTLTALDKAPFPWFGGKRHAAPHVWAALGDVPHYVEPFAGSLAVLLCRPHQPNRPYHSETVNDLDGLLINFWRSVTHSPVETAEAASWPVTEFDKHARSCRLLAWRETEMPALLAGDPLAHDPVMAGWWAWCVSVQIGAWGQGGPWWPDTDGRLRKWPRGQLPTVNTAPAPGVRASLPHLSGNGQGVNRPVTRAPGVPADLPQIGDDGRGVNHPVTRAPGVPADLPQIGDDGQGVNHPVTRAPGVPASRPHLSDNGQGVNHPVTRAPGVPASRPQLGDDGRGVNRPGLREPLPPDPLVMPELIRWFRHLAARLRHVRILNGDWTRTVTTGAAHTLNVRQGDGPCGVFLDPPYGDVGRASLYGKHESLTVAADVRAWALTVAKNPTWRIVIAGFDDEGADLEQAGWTPLEWFRVGHLRGGMGNVAGTDQHQQHRERLWLSPHCHMPHAAPPSLFDAEPVS